MHFEALLIQSEFILPSLSSMISRTKIENVTNLTFNFINITLYILITTAAVIKSIGGNFADIVVCVYTAVATTLLILNEIRTPVFVSENFRFLGMNLGRGLLFLFFGCVILDTISFNIIVGILSWTVGLLYLIVSFVPNIAHPNALIINWQTWKDFSSEGLDLYNPVATPARSRTFHANQLGGNDVHTSDDRTLLMPNHSRPSPMAHVVERHFAQPPIRSNTYVNDSTPDLSIIDTMRSTSAK